MHTVVLNPVIFLRNRDLGILVAGKIDDMQVKPVFHYFSIYCLKKVWPKNRGLVT